ncbi:MAG: MBL fold metallo-hydrolase, partial [Lentisphaerae bacterium]|nr:MBL fold metallo-hydrolase [Lentisphaerota bacterium]
VKIHTIIGGLHLVHADDERLERTATYLQQLGLRRLVACHCTGEVAIARLSDRLSCEVLAGASGDVYEC